MTFKSKNNYSAEQWSSGDTLTAQQITDISVVASKALVSADIEQIKSEILADVPAGDSDKVTKEELQSELAKKADAAAEGEQFATLGDVSNESEAIQKNISAALAEKADKSEIPAIPESLKNPNEIEFELVSYRDSENHNTEVPQFENIEYDGSESKRLAGIATTNYVQKAVADVVQYIENDVIKSVADTFSIEEVADPSDPEVTVTKITGGIVADYVAEASADLATKEQVAAVEAKVDGIEIPSIEGLATEGSVEAVKTLVAENNQSILNKIDEIAVIETVESEQGETISSLTSGIVKQAIDNVEAAANAYTDQQIKTITESDPVALEAVAKINEYLEQHKDAAATVDALVKTNAESIKDIQQKLEPLVTKEQLQAVEDKISSVDAKADLQAAKAEIQALKAFQYRAQAKMDIEVPGVVIAKEIAAETKKQSFVAPTVAAVDMTVENQQPTFGGVETKTVSIDGLTIKGEELKSVQKLGNAAVIAKASEQVTISNVDFEATGYNAIEVNLSNAEPAKEVVVQNVNMTESAKCSNNAISIFSFEGTKEAPAQITIKDCALTNVSNAIRFSNETDACADVVIENVSVSSWDSAWPGLIIFQDYNHGADKLDVFSKMKVVLKNVTGPNGVKLTAGMTMDEMAERGIIPKSDSDKYFNAAQWFYVYHDKAGVLGYENHKESWPEIIIAE